jgi:hypothetical protein
VERNRSTATRSIEAALRLLGARWTVP